MKRLYLLLPLLLSCHQTKLVGATLCEPTEEVCDGRDNDCDGKVDQDLSRACQNSCGTGQERCSRGSWVGCDAPTPKPEECNGKDDNCDGLIDEESNLPVTPCYTGATADLSHGECRFGINRCIGGGLLCVGEVKPKQEVCDAKDNNCDGLTDEGTAGGIDVVFAVDYSGSMTNIITDLRQITSGWATKYVNRKDMKIALLGIPSDRSWSSNVALMKNLSSPVDFATELNLHVDANGGGSEPSLDAIWMVADQSNPLGINWTKDSSRVLIVYTDEEPQSYLSPPVGERDAFDYAKTNGLRVFVFTEDISWGGSVGWAIKTTVTGPGVEKELDEVIKEGSCK